MAKRKLRTERPVIALDGEGITFRPGEPQHYVLLNGYDSATGEHTTLRRTPTFHLYSARVFDFLLALPPTHLKIGFGLNYDVNQWLVSLPRNALEQLWYEKHVRWQQYHIGWTPGRVFKVSDNTGRRCNIWDTFGYFQAGFTETLDRWNIGKLDERDAVQTMKDLRGRFKEDDLDSMESYCQLECELLADLFGQLRDSIHAIGFRPSRYDGAGSLASDMLNRNGVRDAIKLEPEAVHTAVLGAYYGGRTEVSAVGEIGDVFTYDIRSAYPAAIRQLPCLQHSYWRAVEPAVARQLTKAGEIVVSEISWDAGPVQWPPFPWRRMGHLARAVTPAGWQNGQYTDGDAIYSNGGITYPENGTGWHWSAEIRAAMDCYPDMELQFGKSWHLVRRCDHEPFAFIESLYAKRRELEDAGQHGLAHVIKVSLAAISGKLSQGQTEGNEKHVPTYQSFIWAGLTTATVRARILSVIATRSETEAVSVATDGIASRSPLGIQVTDALGGWKAGKLSNLFIVAPGIYSAVLGDGTSYNRTRGFKWRELDFAELHRSWRRNPASTYKWKAKRFHGIGVALHTDFALWRAWLDSPKSINGMPNTRFPRFGADWPPPAGTPMVIQCVPPRFSPPDGMIPESWPYEPRNADRWLTDVENETAIDLLAHWDDGRL